MHQSLRSVVTSMKMLLKEIAGFLLSSPCIWSLDYKYQQKVSFIPPPLTEISFLFFCFMVGN